MKIPCFSIILLTYIALYDNINYGIQAKDVEKMISRQVLTELYNTLYERKETETTLTSGDIKTLSGELADGIKKKSSEQNGGKRIYYQITSDKESNRHKLAVFPPWLDGNSFGYEFSNPSQQLPNLIENYIQNKGKIPENKRQLIQYFIALRFFQIFQYKQLPLPEGIGTERDLYNALIENELELGGSWEDIVNAPQKLMFFLFNESEKLPAALKKHGFSEKPGTAYRSDIKPRAEKIKSEPLYSFMLQNPLANRKAIQEVILSSTDESRSQSRNVSDVIYEQIWQEARKSSLSHSYTAYDFIKTIAVFSINQDTSIAETEYQKEILKGFALSTFGIQKDCDYHFKSEPVRLIFQGIHAAFAANEKAALEESLSYLFDELEGRFPTENDERTFGNQVVLEKFFSARHDQYLFFCQGMLLHLESRLRSSVLDEMCDRASNFSVNYRKKQICYIYILSVTLASEVPLTFEQRERIFSCTYGKTLYNFQAQFWHRLTEKSTFFAEYIKKYIRDACTINDGAETAKKQPLFVFTYGLMNEKDCLPKLKELQKKPAKKGANNAWEKLNAEEVFTLSAALQSLVWKEKNGGENGQSKLGFRELIRAGLHCCGTYINDNVEGDMDEIDDRRKRMYYIYAVQLFCYALSNLPNLQTLDREETKAILLSDYEMRIRNNLYPEEIGRGHMLCGGFRVACALQNNRFDNKVRVTLTEKQEKKYKEWLTAELHSPNRRYAYLMANMLDKIANLNDLYSLVDAIKKVSFCCEFMDYDNFRREN